jgi:RecJ-like exonuclease
VANRLSLRHRLTASPERLDAAELEDRVDKLSCNRCGSLHRGEVAEVTGRLRSVVLTPSGNLPTLEAELFDGSGSVQLVWLGRRRIPGIEPGRRVHARGRVGLHDGRLAIYNPWYELCSA